MEHILFLAQEGYSIPAILCMPTPTADHPSMMNLDDPYPVVILCHGTGSHKDEVGDLFHRLAQALAREGIASLRFDFAGCGDSTAPQQALTFSGEIRDVLTVYKYLLQRPDIDHGRIGILGFSQGARVMAQFLREIAHRQNESSLADPLAIATAVSWSGACHDGPGVFAGWFDLYYEEAVQNGFARIPMGWREDLLVSRPWFDEVQDSHPMEGFSSYPGPVLAIAGTADAIVPCEHAQDIISRCSHPASRSLILPGADHTFCVLGEDQTLAEQVLEETTCWFCQQLKLSPE